MQSRGRKPIDPKPGERHNMLTFVESAGREPSAKMGERVIYAQLGKWKCDCGNVVVCRNRYVLGGRKKSCGCLTRVSGKAWHKGRRLKQNREQVGTMNNLVAAIRELAAAIRESANRK